LAKIAIFGQNQMPFLAKIKKNNNKKSEKFFLKFLFFEEKI
jgi:hypothetical protein